MKSLIIKMGKDLGVCVAIGLVIPHFLLIEWRTIVKMMLSIYVTCEQFRIVPNHEISHHKKWMIIAALFLIGFCTTFAFSEDKFNSFVFMERQGLLLAGLVLKTVRDKKKAKRESRSVEAEKEDKPEKKTT